MVSYVCTGLFLRSFSTTVFVNGGITLMSQVGEALSEKEYLQQMCRNSHWRKCSLIKDL